MHQTSAAPKTISKIKSGWWAPVAFVGGSLTVGTGSSNTSTNSWRRLFVRYLHDRYERTYNCRIGDCVMAIGAMSSHAMSFILPKYLPRKKPFLVFLEHAVNDNGQPNQDLIRTGIEGMIRQARSYDSDPDIVLLRAATRPDCEVDTKTQATFEMHKEVAAHYGAACIDVNAYIQRTLASRGQNWDTVGVDNFHMNDYGNRLWFECLREWFEEQVRIYEENPVNTIDREMPEPLYSDEFQYTKLTSPAKKSKAVELEGDWRPGTEEGVSVPWWMDSVLVGRPGAKLTFTFTGTAIAAVPMQHPNGLKLEAVLDGKEIAGPYTNWVADFGRTMLLEQGMENTEHVLELTVGTPLRGKNLDDPTVRLAYLGVSTGKPE